MVTSAMLTGERRGVSARRSGMTVLGKVAAPKPVNLPSQRLENRGLDPNVEIVPKGTVSWGSTGRSPPASANARGTAAFLSSPPANAGPWGSRPNVSTTRPSSGGSGTRPSTAGSDHSHEPGTPYAWGSTSSRPSSASGALGMAHPQSTITRPCSAESRSGSSYLSRFADYSVESSGPWGGSGAMQKLGENHPQPAQFTLTSADFPTLGSDKNPDLRPQGNASTMRSMSTAEGLEQKEMLQPSPRDWRDEVSSGKEKRPWEMSAPDEGHPPNKGFHRQTFVHTSDSWHYDDGHRNPTPSNLTEDEWCMGGPPAGPYGPPGVQGRFPFSQPGYMRPVFEYGPAAYAQRPHGPGGYGKHGEMYGPYVAQPMVAGHPGVPLGHSMYPNQLPFDGYYGPRGVPGSHYGNVDEREMAMMRMGGGPGMHGGYPHNQGHLVDGPQYRHNGPGSGTRPSALYPSIEQNDLSYSSVSSEGTDKAYPKQADVWISKDAENSTDNNRPFFPRDSNARRNSAYSTSNPQSESDNSRAAPSGHRDWGTVNSDEQMDFSKPVFDEEALSSRKFTDGRISGMENNLEKGANVTRIAEQTRSGNKKNIQVKIKDGLDSYKSLVSEDLSHARKCDCGESEPKKVAHSVDPSQTGPEHPSEVGVLPKDENKTLAMLIVENVEQKDVKFGEKGVSTEDIEAYSTSRNLAHCQEAQALVTPLKGLDQQGSMDGPKRISVVATPSSERHSNLNTSTKLKGGLSSAAGLSSSSHETNKIRDKVQLLKRGDNHPTDIALDNEEAMVQVHSKQGAKGIQEPVQRESHTIRSRLNSHEGDSEWRRKVPAAESAVKAGKPISDHVNSQVVTSSMPGGAITVPEDFADKSAGGSHDYEAQRARLKEAAAQRAKQLQREEEERNKEQKAKAFLKLEELNRRASAIAKPQGAENPKSENMTSTLRGESELVSEAVQKHQADSYGNKTSVFRHNATDNLESATGDNFAEDKCLSKLDDRGQLNFGEQNYSLKVADDVPNNNSLCEVSPAQVPVSSETPGSLGNNVSDTLVKIRKNDTGKRENHRRPSNVNREDLKYQMKMDYQKSLLKERENPPNISSLQNAPVLPMQVVLVSASILASPSTSEASQKDVPVTGSDSSSVADQLNQLEFSKQARFRQKAKQYVLEQKFSSSQPSILEITEHVALPDNGNSVNLACESDVLQVASNATVEKRFESIASSGDGGPISRKKFLYRNTKGKNKIDRPIVITASAGSQEDDHSVAEQSNNLFGDSKHGGGVVTSTTIEPVDKGVDMQNKKSELASVQNGGNDVSVVQDTRDAPAVDRGILQSTDDISAGKIPHVRSQFSKRSNRGSQEARISDKSQGSEGRVWAPVRAANHQVSTNDKQKLDQIEVQSSGAMNSDVVVQNPIRNRRAEIERYVPKPVAKEQAQHQENCQHPVAGSPFSARDQMDHRNTQQGTAKNVVNSETRQQYLSIGENKGHIAGKQGKQNNSWRQRNSNEIRENNKVPHTHQSIEVETALPLQIHGVTVSKTGQAHMETQDFNSEGIKIYPQPHQPDMQKSGHVEHLPKSVSVESNNWQVSQCEADQSTQCAPLPHLQTNNAAKDQDPQLASKRDQNMHEQRFYQVNRSRPKSQKFSTRQVHMEGNHQFTKFLGSEEGEKNQSVEQTFSHQRPRSSTWTPKLQGSADHKEHHLHQKPVSVGQIDIRQVKIDSHEEHHDFERQSVQQNRAPAHLKTVYDQQEGPLSSAKKQHMQDHFSLQLPVSPHQFEGKNQSPNHDVVRPQTGHLSQQQSKSTRPDRQAAEKEQPKQTANSTSYQQRRQSGQGHWQQAGANARFGTRTTDGQEEHSRPAIVQNSKQHDTTIPKDSESSYGARQHYRQDTYKQQPSISTDPIKQNFQVHSQPISSQKPQDFYQPKAGLEFGNGDKNEINHSTISHGGSSWAGEHRSGHAYRGRDQNHARRGRSGGRGGGGFGLRGNESGSKTEHPSKLRLLVDATGGAIPHHVAG